MNMGFPSVRMRRLRRTPLLREIVKEVKLQPSDLVYPIFIDENAKAPVPIKSMPGYSRLPLSQVVDGARQTLEQGVKAVILFGIPSKKDEAGSEAFAENGVVQKAIRNLKKEFGDELAVISDVCLCEYTSHGHCGIVKNGEVQNDPTLETLQKVAVSQAKAGADVVAPSAMMDGQVQLIREGLDDAGFDNTAILAYSAKYASSFYGPFREAAGSTPNLGTARATSLTTETPAKPCER